MTAHDTTGAPTAELIAAAAHAAYVCIITAQIIESREDATIGDTLRAASLRSAGVRLGEALPPGNSAPQLTDEETPK